jgi:hypothetical protein
MYWEKFMRFIILIIYNITFILNNTSYAHDNTEQHAIVHAYPLLELEYLNDENNNKCKMGLLKKSICDISKSKNKKY